MKAIPAANLLLHAPALLARYIVAQQKRLRSSAPAHEGQVQAVEPSTTAAGAKREGAVLGCAHYKRACQVVAPCCGHVYACRHCHDEAEGHRLNQRDVADMICMHCGKRQPAARGPQLVPICKPCFKQLTAMAAAGFI